MSNNLKAKFEVEHSLPILYVSNHLTQNGESIVKNCTWEQKDHDTHNRVLLIEMLPQGLNKDQWTSFVDYRPNLNTMVKLNLYSTLICIYLDLQISSMSMIRKNPKKIKIIERIKQFPSQVDP